MVTYIHDVCIPSKSIEGTTQERNDPARYEEGKQKNQDMDRIMNDNLTQHERYLYGSENRRGRLPLALYLDELLHGIGAIRGAHESADSPHTYSGNRGRVY